jgi:starch phosphorylase
LPEALETWPVDMFERLLPRHLEIIYEINSRFLDEVRTRFIGDEARLTRMSLIGETGRRHLRMANLACVGSAAVNGVAALHTELLKSTVLRDFYEMWPKKFHNLSGVPAYVEHDLRQYLTCGILAHGFTRIGANQIL